MPEGSWSKVPKALLTRFKIVLLRYRDYSLNIFCEKTPENKDLRKGAGGVVQV